MFRYVVSYCVEDQWDQVRGRSYRYHVGGEALYVDIRLSG